jgi:hypothetical protein
MVGADSFAQQLDFVVPGYYRKDTTYVFNGYRYRCIGTKGAITLYNADYQNKLVETVQVYKDTGKYFDSDYGKNDPIINNSSMNQKVLGIINNAFTKDFVSYLKDYVNLTVTLYLNSETGKVEEVSFWFLHSSAFASLPISVYRNIEVQLINEISYTPSAIGKQLNYIFLALMHKPLGKSSSGSEIKPSE